MQARQGMVQRDVGAYAMVGSIVGIITVVQNIHTALLVNLQVVAGYQVVKHLRGDARRRTVHEVAGAVNINVVADALAVAARVLVVGLEVVNMVGIEIVADIIKLYTVMDSRVVQHVEALEAQASAAVSVQVGSQSDVLVVTIDKAVHLLVGGVVGAAAIVG